MKNEDLFRSFQAIDEDILLRSENVGPAKSRRTWAAWGAVAACLCLILSCVLLALPKKPYQVEHTTSQPDFVPTESSGTTTNKGGVGPVEPPDMLVFESMEEFERFVNAVSLPEGDFDAFLSENDLDMNGIATKEDIRLLTKKLLVMPWPQLPDWVLTITVYPEQGRVSLFYEDEDGRPLEFLYDYESTLDGWDPILPTENASVEVVYLHGESRGMKSLYHVQFNNENTVWRLHYANIGSYNVLIRSRVDDWSRNDVELLLQKTWFQRNYPMIDSVRWDVDGDGIEETCTLRYGSTSGLNTFVFEITQDGQREYINTFSSPTHDMRFLVLDGELVLQGIPQGDDPTADIFRIYLQDGHIILRSDELTLEYWGEQGIDPHQNPGQKDLMSLEDWSALFQWKYDGENWYNYALKSIYATAADVNLLELFYSAPLEEVTQADLDFLEDAGVNTKTSAVHKYPIEMMDGVLRQYFGISFDQTNGVGLDQMIYNPEGECYYHLHGDLGEGMMQLISAQTLEDGTVLLHYQNPMLFYPENPMLTITLVPSGNGYQIVSNVADP